MMRARWNGAGPFWKWFVPLALLALAVFADWLRLQHAGVATRTDARHLLARVGWVFFYSGAVLLLGARRWRLQGLGLMGSLFGVAGLLVRVLGREGPQPVGEKERDLIQAGLDVCSFVLAVGVTIWLVWRLLKRRVSDAPTEEFFGPPAEVTDDRVVYEGPERRKGDRRTGDRP